MKGYRFHGIIEKEGDVYCALCLELDIATESDTLEGAKSNLRENESYKIHRKGFA